MRGMERANQPKFFDFELSLSLFVNFHIQPPIFSFLTCSTPLPPIFADLMGRKELGLLGGGVGREGG